MQAIKQFETQSLMSKPKREKPQSIFVIDNFIIIWPAPTN
jgi:hypothetical protein